MMKFAITIFDLFRLFYVFIVFPTIQGDILANPELLQKASSNIAIIMADSTMPLITELAGIPFTDPKDRQVALMQSLKSFTGQSQAPILNFFKLFEHLITIKSMWVDNVIFVEGAFPALIKGLLSHPAANKIKSLRKQIVLDLPKVFNVKLQETAPTIETPAWGVSKIDCPEYWKKFGNGTGVVVATIDTGCNKNHEALKDNYFGLTGFHDPTVSLIGGPELDPTDVQGHGSHCMGSICGAHGVGCAPGARWIACRGCSTLFCTESDLCDCGQWLVSCNNGLDICKGCPNTPHVISCSWGGEDGPDNNFFNIYIAFWKACGIFVCFANGNSGPNCTTTGYPASNQDVCSVGASNIKDDVSSFSSRGATLNDHKMAPKVCCPGEDITSCSHVKNQGYKIMSGTSMATPHLAGCAALLKSSCPKATPTQLENALMGSCVGSVGDSGTCNKKAGLIGNDCGKGRVNVVKARLILADQGCPL